MTPNGDPRFPSQLYLLDRRTGDRTLISHGMQGEPAHGGQSVAFPDSLSDDGRTVVFGSNANNLVPHDIYDATFSGSYDLFSATFPPGSSG